MTTKLPKPERQEHQRPNAPKVDVAALIKSMLTELTQAERETVLQKVSEFIHPIPAPRAGKVLGKIISLFAEKGEWSVEDLKNKVSETNITADAKDVYNAVGYLARRGHVKRIGYGRYVIDGTIVETSDDFGGETTRHEDEYRVGRDQATKPVQE